MTSRRTTLLPRLAALAAITLWGISFVATKAALSEVSPVTLIFSRFALGTAVLILILRFKGDQLIPPRKSWPMLALMGFVGVFVHQMLQAHGLATTGATQAGWLIGLIPIWSSVLSAIFLGEKFGLQKIVGLFLGAAGAILVITRGDLSSDIFAVPSTLGDLLILASTVNWAIYTILGRRTLRSLGSARATTAAMFLGWIMLIPFFLVSNGWHDYESLSSAGWLAVLFLGIGCSGLGYLFWYAALEQLEASQVAAFLYIEPLVTLAAAMILLGESIVFSTIVGGVLVLAGVAIMQKSKTSKAA